MKRKLLILLALLAVMCWLPEQAAADYTFTGSSGKLSAEADFSLSGNTLTVTLTNTSSHDVLTGADVLLALFFNTTHTLTPSSAALNTGSTVAIGSTSNVGEGWQYVTGGTAYSYNSGIGAAGYSIFGPVGNFYSTGVSLDGSDYGILSAGDNTTTGNSSLKSPLIKDSIVFTLTAASGFTLPELGNTVKFQYGTSLSEPSFDGNKVVPLPGAILLLGAGLARLVAYARRREE
jgi:hypothetical protein